MNRLDRLETKIDKVLEVQGEIKLDLSEHMRRTSLLEEQIVTLKPLIIVIKAVVYVGVACGVILGIVRLIQALTP